MQGIITRTVDADGISDEQFEEMIELREKKIPFVAVRGKLHRRGG